MLPITYLDWYAENALNQRERLAGEREWETAANVYERSMGRRGR